MGGVGAVTTGLSTGRGGGEVTAGVGGFGEAATGGLVTGDAEGLVDEGGDTVVDVLFVVVLGGKVVRTGAKEAGGEVVVAVLGEATL